MIHSVAELRARLRGPDPVGVLARGGVGSFVASGMAVALGVLLQLLLSRLLGVDEFGRYVYALTWANFLVVFAVAGYDTAALRFVASYRATGEWGLLRGFLRHSALVSWAVGVVLAVTGALVAQPFVGAEARWLVLAAAGLLPMLVLLRMLAAQLQGFRRVVAAHGVQGHLRPVGIALAVVSATLVLASPITAVLVMVANVGITTVACLVAVGEVRRSARADGHAAEHIFDRRLWGRAAVPLMLIGAAQVLLLSTDTLMIGAMRGTREAGIYAVASQLATAVTFAIAAVNGVLAPLIAELHAGGRREDLQRVLRVAGRAGLLYATPVALALAVFGGPLLGLYGGEFREGWAALAILSLGQLVLAVFGSVGFLMTMTGHEREASLIIAGSAAVNILLNLALIPRFGMTGAATATAVAVSGRALVLSAAARRRLALSASAFGGVR